MKSRAELFCKLCLLLNNSDATFDFFIKKVKWKDGEIVHSAVLIKYDFADVCPNIFMRGFADANNRRV
jgi:hypothetical protein